MNLQKESKSDAPPSFGASAMSVGLLPNGIVTGTESR
jgi:hypothetical protein